MEANSIIYGAIVFLALVFGDLGVSGVAAISGPLAAVLLEIDSLRKKRGASVSNSPSASLLQVAACERRTMASIALRAPSVSSVVG